MTVMYIADVHVGQALSYLGRGVGGHLVDDDDLVDVGSGVHEAGFEARFLVEHHDVQRDPVHPAGTLTTARCRTGLGPVLRPGR